ncbi:uncharacterized protein LY89DRAFT_494046 [Mollisia scopiformis]|uniref:Nephrocystin 3-like N-terminal domain-containing protein n=1 Tax=Mollisia scopiformis TaxID=149040 RepID=A0A194XH75_MOLSC|nr:uncharacterized protein LY89DRAFT_494046 [Mollisia scopiformis]KUJ19560.1 hypothetical protein LY89DRAFT_494046 [Mollisia scopiformis]
MQTCYRPRSSVIAPALVTEILESLRALAYNARFEDMEEGFKGTSESIWKSSEDLGDHKVEGPGFVEWLESGNLFWLNGLPGSGKSTLMKYVIEHAKTKEHLSKADPRNWLLACWFFYELGDETSFNSLLHSLLLQILTAQQHLVPLTLQIYRKVQSRPKRNSSTDETWSDGDLMQALTIIVTQSADHFNLCIFVDGSDECGPREHLRSHVKFLLEWLASGEKARRINMKLCIASREITDIWVQLKNYKTCQIHHWTTEDTVTYAEQSLRAAFDDRLWGFNSDRHAELLETLCREISERSNGVFSG